VVLVLCLAGFALVGLFLFVNSVLVLNTTRYMAVAPSMLWRDWEYVRQLPNLLKQLHDAGFGSPWPAQPTALAALKFRRRLWRELKGALPDAARLVQQHLSLWAFVQLHRDEMGQMIRRRQIGRARALLAETPDAGVRARVVALLNECREAEICAAKSAPPAASTVDTVEWLERLRRFDVLLREHGYGVSEEFSALMHWEADDDAAILDELAHRPVVPRCWREDGYEQRGRQ